MSYLDLEHKTLALFRQENLPNRLLVCVSGGIDSMVLLQVLHELKRPLSLDLSVVHVHHGHTGSEEQNGFRDRAMAFVQGQSEKLGLPFFCNFSEAKGEDIPFSFSESELRELREAYYKELLSSFSESESQTLCLGHHLDDQIEGRLIQLIRGCSSQGFLSMGLIGDRRIRPFIGISQGVIASYAQEKEVLYFDDPSNSNNEPLRNWIRNDWLSELEKRRPGAVKKLGQSLQTIATELIEKRAGSGFGFGDIDHEWSLIFNHEDAALDLGPLVGRGRENMMRNLARFLRALNVENFGQNHLKEIIKRIDNSKNVHIFTICKRRWRLDQHILTLLGSNKNSDLLSRVDD